METDSRQKELEEENAIVNSWVKTISEEGTVGKEVTPEILRSVLENLGARFKTELELEPLGEYSNLRKRPGLNAVWGKDRIDAYKRWVKDIYIPQYEKETGKALPTLYDRKTNTFDNIKHSGMMQFLGELTAYAAGKVDFEKYKRLTERRVEKGRAWAKRRENDPYTPSPNASCPPEFPIDAWDYLKSIK